MPETRPEHKEPQRRGIDPTNEPQAGRGVLSESDPEPKRSTGRPPIWLIIIGVLLVCGLVALHLAGVFGPGSH